MGMGMDRLSFSGNEVLYAMLGVRPNEIGSCDICMETP